MPFIFSPSAPSAPSSSNSKIIKPPRSNNSKKNSKTRSHQAGQKKGRVVVRKVIVEGREFAVKDDSAADGEDEDDGSSNFSFSSQSETEDNDLQKDTTSNEKGMKETPGMKWSKRVLEFQCDKKELMQLRNVELKSRIRDLEVLLSQLSNTMMETMMESSELISQTEILDITIGQLMERLDPGNINIKTGAHT